MDVNALPAFDLSDNPTDCCPRFDPGPWRDQTLRFEDKPFVRAVTSALLHVPINMGRVFSKTSAAIEAAGAQPDAGYLVLSRDLSAWKAEHLFAVTKDVPGQEMVSLSGEFLTRVYEGAYRNAPAWQAALIDAVRERGREVATVWMFYTTCPKCAKVYGKNYVVGVAQLA